MIILDNAKQTPERCSKFYNAFQARAITLRGTCRSAFFAQRSNDKHFARCQRWPWDWVSKHMPSTFSRWTTGVRADGKCQRTLHTTPPIFDTRLAPYTYLLYMHYTEFIIIKYPRRDTNLRIQPTLSVKNDYINKQIGSSWLMHMAKTNDDKCLGI